MTYQMFSYQQNDEHADQMKLVESRVKKNKIATAIVIPVILIGVIAILVLVSYLTVSAALAVPGWIL